MTNLLRTPKTAANYNAVRASGVMDTKCALCEIAPITLFTYWKITPNNFPFDRIAETHEMVVPIRHTTEDGLTPEEIQELHTIKKRHLKKYNYIIEAVAKSIPTHFHLHLIVVKELS